MCRYISAFLVLTSLYFVSAINETCVTPINETSTCIKISDCHVIANAVHFLEEDTLEFAKLSQCGFTTEPLVCCGSASRFPELTTPLEEETTAIPSSLIITPIQHPHLPDATLCGIQNTQYKIVGGHQTQIDEFPWMAALKYTHMDGSLAGFYCSGTLINQRYVLTAAQCLFIPLLNLTEVRLGEWDFRKDPDCFENDNTTCSNFIDVRIIQTIPHSFYNRRSGNNDIALLHLEKKVKYSEYIRPICLPPNSIAVPKVGTRVKICGWGVTETDELSNVKLKAEVPIVNNSVCLQIYPNTTDVRLNQICAGGEEGVDACRGDSGGPLMERFYFSPEDIAEQWYQEGIIYRGLGCGGKGVPSLYTRITRYTAWIIDNLQTA